MCLKFKDVPSVSFTFSEKVCTKAIYLNGWPAAKLVCSSILSYLKGRYDLWKHFQCGFMEPRESDTSPHVGLVA